MNLLQPRTLSESQCFSIRCCIWKNWISSWKLKYRRSANKSDICFKQFCCIFPQLHFCRILFKLVFISHCYHESHRGELFWSTVYIVYGPECDRLMWRLRANNCGKMQKKTYWSSEGCALSLRWRVVSLAENDFAATSLQFSCDSALSFTSPFIVAIA